LVENAEPCDDFRLAIAPVTKAELADDFRMHEYLDETWLGRELNGALHDDQEPYLAVLGDYEFSNQADDIALLTKIATTMQEGLSVFIAAAAPRMFGIERWRDLPIDKDPGKAFQGPDYIKWRAFRENPVSRQIMLTLPRVLARAPYGNQAGSFWLAEEIDPRQVPYMSAAYVQLAKIAQAALATGWCRPISDSEDGGDASGCTAEVGVDAAFARDYQQLGFQLLGRAGKASGAHFAADAQCHHPPKFNSPTATADAATAARQSAVLAMNRILHYAIAKLSTAPNSSRQAAQDELNRWISDYVGDEQAESSAENQELERPLMSAKFSLADAPDAPGWWLLHAQLQPRLPLPELQSPVKVSVPVPQP
jgi:type VI secretion system protein ImpC